MSLNRIIVGLVVAGACLGVALACGPFFPWQLLDNRDQTMADPIGLGFNFEATRLVIAPRDNLKLVEPRDPTSYEPQDLRLEAAVSELAEAEAGAWRSLMSGTSDGVTIEAKLNAARRATSGEAALVAGAGLPAVVLDYIAGAVEFRLANYEEALAYFKAIDRLPPEQRRLRLVAAVYMQGRIHQRLGDFAEARVAFQATRRAAETGAPDPQGLAVASLGEEARVDLVESGLAKVPEEWAVSPADLDDTTRLRLISHAVHLYAEQANRGSKMALLSLREVARLLVDNESALKLAATDPLVRRLLVAYVVARDGTTIWDDGPYGTDEPMVVSISEAVLSQPAPPSGPDLDRLAALAYQAARYEVAEKLVAQPAGPLGLWVRAKLALRRGDRAAAAKDWTAAFAALQQPNAEATIDPATQTRLRGETAVAKLSQGDYRESLRLLFPVADTYWGDVIYVAERVLTVDELKAFVDGLPPARPGPPPPPDSDWGYRVPPTERLRQLLARRLVRVGRIGESLPYFEPTPGLPPDPNQAERATPEEVRAYLAAVEATHQGWPFDWPWQWVDRAEALYKLSVITRQRGMELMGTEGPPDETSMGGSFPYGLSQDNPSGSAKTPSKLLGPDEAQRFDASASKPDARFHYRGIAADQALAAADFLPQRSQAYAATLCWAARHAFASADPAKAEAIYQRYVATGAYQPWAKNFGRDCVEPDFDAARTFWQRRAKTWAKHAAGSVQRHAVLVGGVIIAAVALLVVLLRLRQARRVSAG